MDYMEMEVAGIEPASEGSSIEATTCLSQVLRFAYPTPLCGIRNRLSQKYFAARPLRMSERLARIATL